MAFFVNKYTKEKKVKRYKIENVYQENHWNDVKYILKKKILIANDKIRYYNYKWVIIIQNLLSKEVRIWEFFLGLIVNYVTIN